MISDKKNEGILMYTKDTRTHRSDPMYVHMGPIKISVSFDPRSTKGI